MESNLICPQNLAESCASSARFQIRGDHVKKIFVGNLDFKATEESIRSLFEQHGTVERVSLMTDRDTGRSRGFSHVKKIFVGNLDFKATEESIRSLFEQHGTVERVSLMTDRDTGRSRGFAFVEMTDSAEAERERK